MTSKPVVQGKRRLRWVLRTRRGKGVKGNLTPPFSHFPLAAIKPEGGRVPGAGSYPFTLHSLTLDPQIPTVFDNPATLRAAGPKPVSRMAGEADGPGD